MKVAIIGAGPAGLSSAIELSSSGVEVSLFEQGKVGENIICAEGFFDYFGKIHINLPEALIIKRLIVKSNETYDIPLPSTGRFYTFDRVKWQKNLAEKALELGTKIYENTKIEKKDLNILSKDFDYVIDSTGVKAISHFLFPINEVKKYKKNLMPTIQIKVTGNFENFDNTIKVILYDSPPGYFWIFPKKNNCQINRANIGLGFLTKSSKYPNLKSLLINTLRNEGILFEQSYRTMSSPIPTKRMKTYRIKNIILSGDSLGLCSPLHGGGIDTAYLSGVYISRSIMSNNFKIYENFLKNLDRRFFIERIFLNLWDKFGSQRILSRLKNKGLFKNTPDNIPLTGRWFIKALIRLAI